MLIFYSLQSWRFNSLLKFDAILLAQCNSPVIALCSYLKRNLTTLQTNGKLFTTCVNLTLYFIMLKNGQTYF